MTRLRHLPAAAAGLATAALSVTLAGQPPTGSPDRGPARQAHGEATEQEARAACEPCHAFPPPSLLPRAVWRDEVARMALIRDGASEPPGPRGTVGRMVKLSDEMERVLAYYVARAPETLPIPSTWPAASTAGFSRRGFSPTGAPPDPAVANVRFVDMDGDARLELLATDMRYGMVLRGRPYDSRAPLEVLAQLNNPARITQFDFDRDGVKDLIAGDLGEFLPGDHARGAVVWLRGLASGTFRTMALKGWPRVADVQPADFNGDGLVDLAVAAFGWRKVGHVAVLENHTKDYASPIFVTRVIDPRPGAIHATVADLNADGRPDLVVLLAQQFETVVAYLNTGTRETAFTPSVIYTAPHPNWGSSGMDVVDLDKDGDLDVLLVHGDTFDDAIVKPYHGVQWLENRGSYPFTVHDLADLPGAVRAQAADLDGDGDLDVIACAFLAVDAEVDESALAALVWLEQTAPGVFARRTLEMGHPRNATLDAGDFDLDGDVDLAVGKFTDAPTPTSWVEVWQNQRNKPAATR